MLVSRAVVMLKITTMDKTQLAIQGFDQCAEEYQDKFMNLDHYHEMLDIFCTEIVPGNATVLDVACGPGNITRYLLEKRPELTLLGIDLSTEMLKLARSNNPGAQFRIMDAREIEQLDLKFEAVVCGFGLPYLSREDALQFIGKVAAVLKPRGIFYLSTMEDDYERSRLISSSTGKISMYIHYHQADYLSQALEAHGFELIKLSRIVEPEPTPSSTRDLVIISRLR